MSYSSKYYNPQKAHEYYMKNRELTGRKSTAGLNDTGKAAAKNVKQNLMTERKKEYEKLKAIMNSKIKMLRDRLKQMIKTMNLDGYAKESLKERVKGQIASLREQYKSDKSVVKNKYDEKYIAELDKIKTDVKMRNPNSKVWKKKK